jgi:hypothetical protein
MLDGNSRTAKRRRAVTDDLVKRPDDEQDDLTLVYMWAYKMAEKKYKSRIEQLEAALRRIEDENNYGSDGCWVADSYPDEIARAALGEKKDD